MFQPDENLLNIHYGADEIEMLQTDIQRFLAILAFCLLPVFMLVQSIPVVSQEKDAVIENFTRRFEEQARELNRLRIENTALHEEATRLLRDAKVNERIRSDLKNAMERIEQQRTQIEALIHEKFPGQDDPAGLKRQLVKRDQGIKKLSREKSQLEDFIKEVAKSKGLKASDLEDLKPDFDGLRVKEEKGLYVAFESDRVFLDLLESGKVQLLLHVAGVKESYRAVRRGGRTEFEPVDRIEELDLWEIKGHMVPAEILHAFRKWTTLASREVMFIVGLSPELSRQIGEKGGQGGRILIGQGGKVYLQAHGE